MCLSHADCDVMMVNLSVLSIRDADCSSTGLLSTCVSPFLRVLSQLLLEGNLCANVAGIDKKQEFFVPSRVS